MKIHETGHMTLRELAALLKQAGARAMVVQYFEGRWRASVRTRFGIPVVVDGPHMITAMRALVDRLQAIR